MAAVTHLGATASTSQASSYASATFAPVVGDLLVVFVAVSDSIGTGAAMAESAGGGTYTLVGSALAPLPLTASLGRLHCFVRNTLCETNVTRTFTYTTSDAGTGAVVSIAKATGMHRAGAGVGGAIRQFDNTDNGAAAGTPNTIFAGVALTANACVGAAANNANPAAMTAPASFTELVDTGYATPATGFEYASRDSGHTSATITWGATSATAWAAFSVELDTTVPRAPDVVMGPLLPSVSVP